MAMFDCDELVDLTTYNTSSANSRLLPQQINVPKNVGYILAVVRRQASPTATRFKRLMFGYSWTRREHLKNLLNYYLKLKRVIDSAMFNPVQWHYTAAPINALIDYTTCETRLGLC